jgi:zinc transport system permease protein
MTDFRRALAQHEFLQNALLTGLLASIACGVVGSYVVVRRISYLAGGIAHCVLGGIGAARYFQVVHRVDWLTPLVGAALSGLLAALVIGVVSLRARQREDTVIGAVWAIGMAVGVIFLARTPGFGVDPMSYLFGSIVLVERADVWLLAGLDVLVVGAGLLFYHPFAAVCFDEEFARLRGLNVEFYYLLLLCLTALTVVLLVSVVGIVLVIALLTLPVAAAGFFCRTLWQLMIASALLTGLLSSGGLALSYSADLPAGATTILLAGMLYVIVLLGALLRPRRTAATPRPGQALS